ncbi:MAG: hypothetical protein ACOCT0_05985 [Halobacteriota archaeon]
MNVRPRETASTYSYANLWDRVDGDADREMYSFSGLSIYPERGDRIRYFHRDNDSAGWLKFGAQDTGDHYGFRVGSRYADSLQFYKDGSLVEGSDFDMNADEWYEVEIDYGASDPDNITARVYEIDGTEVGNLTVTDTDYDSGGVGFQSLERGGTMYWDDVRVETTR